MKSLKIFLLFITFSINYLFATDLRIMESVVMHSAILNQDVRFSVCLPENYYKTKKTFPVAYLLHGLGDDESSWLEYGQISQYADKLTNDGDIAPMIFIMPQAFTNYYVNDYAGTFLYQDMFVKELVPHIDSLYRTVADKQHRALMGYSMGGFGALILHLKYPDIFGSTVPLSISIRTDEQYMKEDSAGWDKQWGRLFGKPGLKGADRITKYYKENSPFYMLQKMSAKEIAKLHIYMDCGDKEQTLCRSNEELHILMQKYNIPHEYRIRDGGHSFDLWRSALPNALRFISDMFEAKPYRGDETTKILPAAINNNLVLSFNVNNKPLSIYLPNEYSQTNRLYPVMFLIGNFDEKQKSQIATEVNKEIEDATACPMILVFLPVDESLKIQDYLTSLEKKFRIRSGFRFRAIAGFQNGGSLAFSVALKQEQFRAVILLDANLLKDSVANQINNLKPEWLKRTSIYISAPDKGKFGEGNGFVHIIFRDKEFQHEYRVSQGLGGFELFLNDLPEMIKFAAKGFHK